MATLLQHPVLEVVRTAIPQGISVYLVGGAVRDELLGKSTHDFDFVVSAEALQIARKVANKLRGAFYPLDNRRQYGRVIWNTPAGERLKLDFALQAGDSIEEDLVQRDFTINALAIDLRNTERWIDPLRGAQDLLAKSLRACSEQAFQNDPLRVVRGVRFALSLRFRIEPATWHRMLAASPGLSSVSGERLAEELFRLLSGYSVASAIRLLDRVGALPYTFPELIPLKEVEQSPPHYQDAYQHTLEVVSRLEEILELLSLPFEEERHANLAMGLASLHLGRYRSKIGSYLEERFTPERNKRALLFLAALYHDSGKALTGSKDENNLWHFFGHEQVSAKLCERRGRELALANDEIEWMRKVVLHHMRPIFLTQTGEAPSRRAVYRFFRQTGETGIGVCLLSLADVLGIYGYTLPTSLWSRHLDVVRKLLQAWWEEKEEQISPPPLLDGHEVMQRFGITPGPLIGKILEGIREAQAAGEIHSKEEALALAEKVIAAERSHRLSG
ncbi:MAG: HD domain-containing protein [Anaerolineales bacterium]|nr:HD domain-containing protein [Anaerolineales bacterium]MDW8161101.1 HD domain-containing protein [Anaerolineales bacterium]